MFNTLLVSAVRTVISNHFENENVEISRRGPDPLDPPLGSATVIINIITTFIFAVCREVKIKGECKAVKASAEHESCFVLTCGKQETSMEHKAKPPIWPESRSGERLPHNS